MLSLKNVTEVAKAEKVVEAITSQVEAVFKVTDLKLSQWTDIHVYYEAKTVGGKDVVIEVAINTLDAYVLLDDGKGWRHLGSVNR